jgi:outer membrane protein
MIKRLLMAGMACGALAQPAQAGAGDWLLRVRGIWVAPNEDSGGINPAFPSDEVSVTNSFMPEVDVSYFLTDSVALELIAATTKHEIGGKSGTPAAIGELASTWVLPPTLTLQYHFAPDAKLRPYVGAGINYTLYYSEDASNGLEAAVGATDVSLSDSFGYALQAGVDIDVSKTVFVNLDVKYVDMDTTARLRTAAAGLQTVKVDINPFIVGAGVGFRF